jgi:hypothetical protein
MNLYTYRVNMLAFCERGTIREVDCSEVLGDLDPNIQEAPGENDILELIFKFGQNMFQSRPVPSVSVGDVVELNDKYFMVAGMGYFEISKETFEKLPGNLSARGIIFPQDEEDLVKKLKEAEERS